jgi:hypothetical protein
MGLIDANALKEYCMRASKSDDDFRRVSLATLASVIDVQPTAYDPDKVVEQLDELRKECKDLLRDYDPNYFIDKAIEIVKGGGVNG